MIKNAIVTGASGGLGSAIVKLLLGQGYQVYGCGRSQIQGFSHPSFHFQILDLTDQKKVMDWVNFLKSLGGIDVLVHNAGTAHFSPLEEIPDVQLKEMIAVNFQAPIAITQQLTRSLKEKKGHIIFVSSIAAVQVSPWGSIYAATKAGLLHFAREIFAELRKYDVKVSSILPEMIDTKFYETKNFGIEDSDPISYLSTEDVCKAIGFLLSQSEASVVSEITLQSQHLKIKRKKRSF
ncbi:KR domain protein [Leptospira ryugenii]|uniref:KR domain protein n=1 Tax=Leptospira ryugenii TaxID=1917863 RepID=A0A2P2DZX2_9LEPT|nr:SDR family oxidoreductase [Leptospira ryugenii]GBF50173.1 KR domain protein [Leptospira ryugenii]